MNPYLHQLHSYPFEKLAALKQGLTPPAHQSAILLSIGEPKQPTPAFIQQALIEHLSTLSQYPSTQGLPQLRSAIARWIEQRFDFTVDSIDSGRQVLPVNGTREALFSLVQAVLDPKRKPLVLMPNPFYQIYEGAALLAGAEPYYLNTTAETHYLPDFDQVPDSVWQRCGLLFVCSPGNPSGAVFSAAMYEKLLNLSQRFDFVIASDECYTEIYADETQPPLGLLQVAHQFGNTDFKRCVMLQSLSKRSNAPGLRSGFVAGDADILQAYLRYRTYHGCPMPLPTQYASIAAWQDESHVQLNRQLYREKLSAFIKILADVSEIHYPPASFYIWLKIPQLKSFSGKWISDTEFAQQLFAQQNVTVLPGSYLSRLAHGINPGENHLRIALVAPLAECMEAAIRIKAFISHLNLSAF
jgi:N-succinyldiaminopimelate aminotransferase